VCQSRLVAICKARSEACGKASPFAKMHQTKNPRLTECERKKPRLTERERGRIEGLSEAGMSKRSIARSLGRSPDTICRALAPKPRRKTRKKAKIRKNSGAQPALTDRELRRLVRTAAKGDRSAAQLKADLQLNVHVRTIQRALARVDWLIYTKMVNTLPLKPEDKAAREAWARERLLLKDAGPYWDSIIFSDEKKWNLDGPDGFQNYWRDLRRPPRRTKRRQAGGGSVMVWAAFSARGKSQLVVLTGRQNSDDYVYTLSEFLLPFAHLNYGTDFIFQQDNASIHTSARTKDFFADQEVEVLDWPSKSPDLNPIENLWSIMSRRVYSNGRQFERVPDLKAALFEAWHSIPLALLDSLIASMPRRCLEVVAERGDRTHY
jgi:transposase/DNA-binding CsgD family transcriptional regulator